MIRVGQYVGIIAREMGIGDATSRTLRLAALLHDVGKIGISDTIFLKPSKFTDEEYDLMKKHCDYGHSICDPVSGEKSPAMSPRTMLAARILRGATAPLLQAAGAIALTHHEKWDGSGYPHRLSGEDIPIEGRITAVADVFDVLSSKRPY